MKKFEKFEFNKHEIAIGMVSVKGHQKIENQDNICVFHDDNKIIMLSSDGLGSAINSKIGSSNVNNLAKKILLSNDVNDEFPLQLRSEWIKSLGNINPLSCDTTFKFIYITPTKIIYGGIGDGWLVGVVDDSFFSLSNKDNFANQTESIMSIGYKNNFRMVERNYEDMGVLSLATDGFSEDFETSRIEDFLKISREELLEKGEEYVDNLEELIEQWPIESNQDDKSVIILGVKDVK